MNNPELSIIVPCYNEGKAIPELIKRFSEHMKGGNSELVLVDNGSGDDTLQIINEHISCGEYPYVKLVRVVTNIGYGNGIFQGLKAAKGKYLAFTHADLQCSPKDVFIAYKKLTKAESKGQRVIVKGNRQGRFSVLSSGLHLVASTILLTRFDDVNGQPKVFPRELLDSFRDPPKGFGFDLYVQYLAKKKGFSILGIPVLFEERKHGQSHWNINFVSKFRTIMSFFGTVFELRFKL